MAAPGYWMHETSGVLRPAVEAYLNRRPMSKKQIAAMRAYLRQWIMSPVWDANPHIGEIERAALAQLRAGIDALTSHKAIDDWLAAAFMEGHDPL